MHPKANQNDQHGTKREPKGSQSEPRNSKTPIAERVGKNNGFYGFPGQEKGAFCIEIYKQITSKIIPRSDYHITWNLMPKGCKNGAKFDAQTHSKSMPTLVTKKLLKLSKFMFSRMVQSYKFIVTTMVLKVSQAAYANRK